MRRTRKRHVYKVKGELRTKMVYTDQKGMDTYDRYIKKLHFICLAKRKLVMTLKDQSRPFH